MSRSVSSSISSSASVRPHQARPDRVAPQDQQHRRGQQQDDAVEGHRDAFGLVLVDVFGDQPGGEREERDEQEQQQVQPHEGGVGPLEVLGDRVVREPGRADGGEAGHVGQVGGPQAADRAPQIPAGVAADPDVQDQQGDGDGEDAVAEGLQPPGPEPAAPRLRRRFRRRFRRWLLSAHRPTVVLAIPGLAPDAVAPAAWCAAGPACASLPPGPAAAPRRPARAAAGTRSGRWCCAARQRPTWPGRRERLGPAAAICPCARSPRYRASRYW